MVIYRGDANCAPASHYIRHGRQSPFTAWSQGPFLIDEPADSAAPKEKKEIFFFFFPIFYFFFFSKIGNKYRFSFLFVQNFMLHFVAYDVFRRPESGLSNW